MWSHWKGHEDTCIKAVRAEKGYTSGQECTCRRAEPPRFTGAPTFAPVDYILNSDQADFPLNPIELM